MFAIEWLWSPFLHAKWVASFAPRVVFQRWRRDENRFKPPGPAPCQPKNPPPTGAVRPPPSLLRIQQPQEQPLSTFLTNFSSSTRRRDAEIDHHDDDDDGAIGFYVHIPYCRRRCRYCNFAIVPVGEERHNTNTSASNSTGNRASLWNQGFEALNENYTSAILLEIQTLISREKAHLQNDTSTTTTSSTDKKITLQSIYFGGGTPSLAPISTIQAILEAILDETQSPFVAAHDIEITLEMDPGTFDLAKLQAFRDLGVNRISLGIQSFSSAVLQQLGRQHTVDDIWESMRLLRVVYGTDDSNNLNYSIDLISGLPGVSMATWAETLYTAVNVLDPPPNHLSIYDLQIEAGTVFAKWYGNDQNEDDENGSALTTWHATRRVSSDIIPPLPSSDDTAFQYQFKAGYLRAKGFEHYEVSSYARRFPSQPDQTARSWRSRHNQVYWGYKTQWHAVGLGATSYIRGNIASRPNTLFDYLQWVQEQQQQQKELAVQATSSLEMQLMKNEHHAAEVDRLMDVVLKRLRTAEGLDLNRVRRQFGESYVVAILKGAQLGLELELAVLENCSSRYLLRLVDSKGFLFSNSIISSIFVELERVERAV